MTAPVPATAHPEVNGNGNGGLHPGNGNGGKSGGDHGVGDSSRKKRS